MKLPKKYLLLLINIFKKLSKENTRKRILIIRNNLNSKKQIEWSELITQKLIQSADFLKAKSILFYYPFGSEVDTLKLLETSLKEDKITLLPRVISEKKTIESCVIKDLKTDIENGYGNIQEPKQNCLTFPNNEIDLIIVPGVAFSLKGERLGYGKGYYDRFLKKTSGKKIGICFESQITDKIILEKHDVLMDQVITEQRIIHCS